MRKIESLTIARVRAGLTGAEMPAHNDGANVLVACDTTGDAPRVAVYLHGNLIAKLRPSNDGRRETISVEFTLAGWPTATTRRWVNVLLREFGDNARVYQSKGAQWVECPAFGVRDGAPREIGPHEWVYAS